VVLMELKGGAWHGGRPGVGTTAELYGGVDISLEDLQRRGIFGIESERMLANCKRTDIANAVYVGSGHGVSHTMTELIPLVLRRIEEERLAFAQTNGIDPADVYAKIGCANEIHVYKQHVCYRYSCQKQYPDGATRHGQPTPTVFKRSSGRILLYGLEHNGIAAAPKAAGARKLNALQRLTHDLNQATTALTCMVSSIIYSNASPASLYIMFCRPHVSPAAIATHTHQRAKSLRDAAAALREQQAETRNLMLKVRF